jgi:class 3 adenylate cyclase
MPSESASVTALEAFANEVDSIEQSLDHFDPASETAWPSSRVREISDRIHRLRRSCDAVDPAYSALCEACLINPFENALVRSRHYDPAFIRSRETAEVERARSGVRTLSERLRVEVEVRRRGMICTVIRCDYVGYQHAAKAIDNVLGSEGVMLFQRNIRESVLNVVRSIGLDHHHALLKAEGDCVWLRFSSADQGIAFIAEFEAADERETSGAGKRFAMRRFRLGAATGAISPDPLCDDRIDFAGLVMTIATRLEGAAEVGGALVDMATWEAASPASRCLLAKPEDVVTKHGIPMLAARYVPQPEHG